MFCVSDDKILEAMRRIFKCASLENFAKTMSETLSAPVVVLDSSMYALAAGISPKMTAEERESIPVDRYVSIHNFSRADREFPAHDDIAYFINSDAKGRPSRWARYSLKIGFREIGYICVVLGKRQPDEDFEKLLAWASHFALVLLVSMRPSGVFGTKEQFFFTTLINSPQENGDEAMLEAQRKNLGIRLLDEIHILTTHMQPQDYAYPVSLDSILQKFAAAIPYSYTFLYKENIVSVFSRNAGGPPLKEYVEPLRPVLEESGLYCGVSSAFAGLLQCGCAYNQAIRAIRLGRRLENGGLIFLYDSYAHFDMMDICAKQADLLSFCHPAVRRLLAYDEANRSVHLRTLYLYIKNNASIAKTAEEMEVHRNTVKYRISQIAQIMGMELREGMNLFQIHWSLDILRYLGKIEL